MRTTLITGGAGFVGSHFADFLIDDGDRVIVLDDLSTGCHENLPLRERGDRLELVVRSVADVATLDRLVRGADRVFHLAAAVGVRLVAGDPIGAIETNVAGTANVLRACARHRRPVLIVSSSEVYGKSDTLPLREDSDLVMGPTNRARWSYGMSKALGEHMAVALHRQEGLPVVSVRLFNIAGRRQRGEFGMVIPRLVSQALRGEPLTVYGDGAQTRCFCHVADAVPALARLLETRRAHGEVVNVGGDEPVSIRALAELIREEATGSAAPIVQVPFDVAYGEHLDDPRCRRPDLSKARDLVGFRAKKTLREIIHDVVAGRRKWLLEI